MRPEKSTKPLHTIAISDPADPRIEPYRALPENRLPSPTPAAPHGLFIAEGEKVVRRFAEGGSRFGLASVLLAEARLERDRRWLADLPSGTPIYTASRAVMDAVVGFPIHRGVLAAGLRRPNESVTGLLKGAQTAFVLEGLANHDNVGGILRVAAALGRKAVVLLDPTSCDPLYRKAIRVSMGHALAVPFTRLEDGPSGVRALRHAGFETAALSLDRDAVPMHDWRPTSDRVAWLLGSEGAGLTDAAAAAADRTVRIEIEEGIDSLNVVTAAAIAMHGTRSLLKRPYDASEGA
ncbi:MAG: RNA methyltransferase [Planctomycetota bacterium]